MLKEQFKRGMVISMNTTIIDDNVASVLADRILFVPRVYVKQSCYEALQAFQSNPEAPCIIVCDKKEQPIGLVKRDSFFLKLNGPGGLDTWERQSILKLMNKAPSIANIESSLELLGAALNIGFGLKAPVNNYVIILKQDSIMGVIEASALVK
jgi:hypothetical protein